MNGFSRYLEDPFFSTDKRKVTVDEYISLVERGLVSDPALTFHLKMGATVVAKVEKAMIGDRESLEWGALIKYDLSNIE